MKTRLTPFTPLRDAQLGASDPRGHASLSASAGTGKTHVLTARVLRLLLSGADPASILCLTFTKAGAAEMAHRISERLAYWVRLKDAELGRELEAIGEDPGPDGRATARTLFAKVLDAAGGGLRIQTIHAFAQSLLAAFPAEAGLVPGFRPLEGREQQQLARATLADLLVRAEAGGDLGLIDDIQALSHRLGEAGAEKFLAACARAPDALSELGSREAIAPRLRRAFGLPAGDVEEAIVAACCDDRFDMASLGRIAAANRTWGTATGLSFCDVIAQWRSGDPAARAVALEALAGVVLTKTGDPRKLQPGQLKADPDLADHAARIAECCTQLLQMRRTARLVESLAAGLRAGQAYAGAYRDAKRAAGLVDFDDLIRRAEALLSEPGMGEWVRYKLDQATDHILVDEAQDTNARQWQIVAALTEEYFAGQGAVGRHRTIFAVGDFKQAIFGFQGTNPGEFEEARRYFEKAARDARDAAIELRVPAREVPPDFRDLAMDRSFRSAPPVLAAIDGLIATLGHDALGLPRAPNPHLSHHGRRPGSVTLWRPFRVEDDQGDGEGEESWVSDSVRLYATRLARQVRHWIDHPFRIDRAGRALRPEDILILVKRRSTLAALIVARLHAEGVPVAGVDRLLLSAPLAVQDLLAAARFAVQPLDDLNLAGLLVSPLIGWSQEQLYAAGKGRAGRLWPAVRDGGDAAAVAQLNEMLRMADFTTPHIFFETLLSGPFGGRRKLLERLGPEARDPIEELLSSALEFERSGAPSLQQFLDWFARGEVEVVRDPSAPLDAVRVMTVHGSKGLQAPVVILADATVDPDRSPGRDAVLTLGGQGEAVPVFRPRKEELVEPLRSQLEAADRAEREEHWRLLYVAMTRAEERLFVGGALGPADRNGAPEASWHAAIERTLDRLGADQRDDPIWGQARLLGDQLTAAAGTAPARAIRAAASLPDWAARPAPDEARPPRPLAPSAPSEDDAPDPPPTPAARAAADRGRLLHQLFERLPGVPADERADRADAWLRDSAGIDDARVRHALIESACAIIGDPAHAELFAPGALTEAPIAAVTAEGVVISGTVDRLRVSADRVQLVDFKTGRQAPIRASDIPPAHLRQMAAYSAALAIIFPDREVEASLLYTAGPVLHRLPEAMLAAHAPA